MIWSTAEPLLPSVHALAEATWDAPVLNNRITSESIAGAFSCYVAAGFHISEDLNVIEPIDRDGTPVPPARGTDRQTGTAEG